MQTPRKPLQKPLNPRRVPNSKDTPAKAKLLASAPPKLGTESKRILAVADLAEQVPVVDLKHFLGLVPELQDGIDVKLVLQKLRNDKTITASNAWKGFYKNPQKMDQHEDFVFKKWGDITNAIIDAVTDREPTIRFFCNPAAVPESYSRDNNSKPDCYGILEDQATQMPVKWFNVLVPAEFKKKDISLDVNDNRKKIIWSLHHIMCEDARRRFAFAFTIENTNMRLWFANRSEVVASFPFNFNKEHSVVVDIFLRLAFASKTDLGMDPTIELRDDSILGNVKYDIKVDATTYRTLRLISNVGAESLRGRGTRVWEVRRVTGENTLSDQTFALKDSWVDKDRDREEDILRAIRTSETKDGKVFKGNRHLMDVEEGWDVKIDGTLDETRTCLQTNGEEPSARTPTIPIVANPLAHVQIKSVLPVVGGPSIPEPTTKGSAPVLQYPAKIHHRVVFKKVAKTIVELDTITAAFTCLADVVNGLRDLHECGWVHRDISSGNVFLDGGIGKLSDFEYAKRNTHTTRHGIRTGTAFFMSTEINANRYLHDPISRMQEDIDLEQTARELEERYRAYDEGSLQQLEDSPTYPPDSQIEESESPLSDDDSGAMALFHHNPLHDLESVFWLAVYIVLCSTYSRNESACKEGMTWEQHQEAHASLAVQLFQNQAYRCNAFDSSSTFKAPLNGLLPQAARIMLRLNALRSRLYAKYQEVESNLGEEGVDFDVAADLYLPIITMLRDIATLRGNKVLRIDLSASSDRDAIFREPFVTKTNTRKRAVTESDVAQNSDEAGDDRPAKAAKRFAGAVASTSTDARIDVSASVPDSTVVGDGGPIASRLRRKRRA